jgi:hypothetical protein
MTEGRSASKSFVRHRVELAEVRQGLNLHSELSLRGPDHAQSSCNAAEFCLDAVKARVALAAPDQFVKRSVLDEPPATPRNGPVGGADRRKPVRDNVTVRSFAMRQMFSWTMRSLSESRALVASSKISCEDPDERPPNGDPLTLVPPDSLAHVLQQPCRTLFRRSRAASATARGSAPCTIHNVHYLVAGA